MADDSYESDDDAQDEPTPRDLRHQLAERAREADELRTQLEATRRDAVFAKALAGVDHPGLSYFQEGYKGELDAEAIKKAATDAGFLSSSQPQQNRQPDDLSGHARMASNAAGANGANEVTWQDALAEADRIPNEAERTAAILDVVERYGGATSRSAQ